jgi:hypothetical protein
VTRRRTERGSALVEVTWLSILLLVPLVYVVVSVFDVQRSAFALDAATRAAGRAYTLSPSQAQGVARARAAAQVALADQGLDLSQGSFALGCEPRPHECLSPGSVVHVRMVYPVDLPLMPEALGGDTPSIRVDAEHSVPYGSFREARPWPAHARSTVRRRCWSSASRSWRSWWSPWSSTAYLRRAGLDSLADGAALAAADGIQGRQVYEGGLGSRARIDPVVARRYVADYLSATGAARRYPGLSYDVRAGTDRVVVHVASPLDLPIVPPGWDSRPLVTGTAASFVMVSDW